MLKDFVLSLYYLQESWINHQNKLGKNYAKCFALVTETNLSRDDTNWIMMKIRLGNEQVSVQPAPRDVQAESCAKVTQVHLSCL